MLGSLTTRSQHSRYVRRLAGIFWNRSKSTLLAPRIWRCYAVFFRVTHDGQSERRATRSLRPPKRRRCIFSSRRHSGKQARFWGPSAQTMLLAGKRATHVPSANTGAIHAVRVGGRLTSHMRASLNLGRLEASQLDPPFSLWMYNISTEKNGIYN